MTKTIECAQRTTHHLTRSIRPIRALPGECNALETMTRAHLSLNHAKDFEPMTVTISTDLALLDIALIHQFLSEQSHWARGVSRAVVERSIAHSLCFGLFEDSAQVGFARVITDRATSAHLCDVFVVEHARGRGHSRRLIEAVLAHPDLQQLRRFTLKTTTAGALYAQYGWQPVDNPDGQYMRIASNPNLGGH